MSLVQPIATKRRATGIDTGRLSTWWIIGSEIVIFGGLLACYVLLRILHPEWSEDSKNTNIYAGTLNTFILLTSSLFAVLAHHSTVTNNTKAASNYLILTILGAMAFLGVKAIEWTIEIQNGFTITKSLYWSFYYVITGLHGLHVIGGAVIMAILAVQVRKGKHLNRVELIGNYWHFVDIIWIFLFPTIYLIG